LKDNLLTPHLQTVIDKEPLGLDAMVDNSQFGDLSRLFRLCQKVPSGLPSLKASLKKSIVKRGREINQRSLGDEFVDVDGGNKEAEVTSNKDNGKGKVRSPTARIQPAISWVQDVLNLKDKFDALWKLSFQQSRDVEISLNEARSILNSV
jgi:cullin 3